MRPLIGPVPEPAERACSALRRCPSATLATGTSADTDSSRARVRLAHPDPRTDELLLVVDLAGVPRDGSAATLEVLDLVLGGPADGHCRRVVTLHGTVTVPDRPAQRRAASALAGELADPALLGVGVDHALVRLRPHRIGLVEPDGVTDVLPADLLTSGPDPFAELEGLWLAHLGDPRCAVVGRLVERVRRGAHPGSARLVGIDRAGLDLRIDDPDGVGHTVRLPFDEPCVGVAELAVQIRLLAGCPRAAHPLRDRSRPSSGRG